MHPVFLVLNIEYDMVNLRLDASIDGGVTRKKKIKQVVILLCQSYCFVCEDRRSCVACLRRDGSPPKPGGSVR